MKKTISYFLVVSLVLVATFGFLCPLNAKAENSVVIYQNDFEAENALDGIDTVTNFGYVTISDTEKHSGTHSLRMAHHGNTWYSPSINLYDRIKAAGAGTYHFSAYVMYTGEPSEYYTTGGYMLIRGGSSSDANSFITEDVSGNYFKRISQPQYISGENQWRLFTGSLKVLESDLERDNGNFLFCFDGLPFGSNVTLFFDDIKITKLSDSEITNGDFSDGITGWRTWSDFENVDHITVMEQEDPWIPFYGNYLRTVTYGSIACNVDQILSYYGPGQYTLSFKMRVEDVSEAGNVFTFYLSTNFSNYHKWLAQRTFADNSGWVSLSIPINISAIEFFGSLKPDEKEVHFRIQSPSEENVEFSISNVSLVPKALTNFELATANDSNVIQINESSTAQINIVSRTTNAPARCTWSSSDSSIATVDANGVVTAHRGGVVTIYATSRNGQITKGIQIKVNNTISNFTVYGQMKPGWCWAACAKMVAHQYVKSISGNETIFGNSLVFDLDKNGYDVTTTEHDERVGIDADVEKMMQYYTGNSAIILYTIGSRDNYQESMSCGIDAIISVLDQGKPIIIDGFELANNEFVPGTGHSFVAYGYYYNQNNEFYLITYDPASMNYTGKRKDMKYTSLLNGTTADGYAVETYAAITIKTTEGD